MSMATLERAVPKAAFHPVTVRRAVPTTVRAEAGTAAVSCSKCCLKGVCLPHGLNPDGVGHLEELTRLKRKIVRGSTLYRTGDGFAALYAVRSGSFKSVGISRSGTEKVTGLHLPGEIMGLEAISSRQHGYDAIALEDSEVCVIPFAQLSQLALRLPELQAQLLRIVSGDISRDRGLMLLLGSMDAEQRIAAFLLSLSKRYQRLGYSSTRFGLRMTRDEIGSYLGLTLETVSRVISRMQKAGSIGAHQREIEVKDMQALQDKVGL